MFCIQAYKMRFSWLQRKTRMQNLGHIIQFTKSSTAPDWHLWQLHQKFLESK